MEGQETTNRRYELMLILSSDKSAGEQEEIFNNVKNAIEEKGGSINKEVHWGLREFTYSIKHQDQGIYHLIYFHLEPRSLSAINKIMVLNPKILRHITSQIPDGISVVEEQPIAEEKEEKPARNKSRSPRKPLAVKAKKSSKPENVEKKEEKKEKEEKEEVKSGLKIEVVKSEEGKESNPKEKKEDKKTTKTATKTEAKSKSESERLAELDKKLDEILNE